MYLLRLLKICLKCGFHFLVILGSPSLFSEVEISHYEYMGEYFITDLTKQIYKV